MGCWKTKQKNNTTIDDLVWEVPMLKSMTRHLRKHEGYCVKDAVKVAKLKYTKFIKNWYQRKYMSQDRINVLKPQDLFLDFLKGTMGTYKNIPEQYKLLEKIKKIYEANK